MASVQYPEIWRYPEVWRGEYESKTYRIRIFDPTDAFVERLDDGSWNDFVEDDTCAGVYMTAFLETRALLLGAQAQAESRGMALLAALSRKGTE